MPMASTQLPLTVTDRDKAIELFNQLYEHHAKHVEIVSGTVQRGFDLNKQVAAFYERLMLLDLGTLALSVNALVSLGSKFSSHYAGKIYGTLFCWLIVTAWLLLLVSTFLCRQAVARTIEENRKMSRMLEKESVKYSANVAGFIFGQIAGVLQGSIKINNQQRDVRETFEELRKQLQELSQKQFVPSEVNKESTHEYKWAVTCMSLALILLCAAAVKLLLTA